MTTEDQLAQLCERQAERIKELELSMKSSDDDRISQVKRLTDRAEQAEKRLALAEKVVREIDAQRERGDRGVAPNISMIYAARDAFDAGVKL